VKKNPSIDLQGGKCNFYQVIFDLDPKLEEVYVAKKLNEDSLWRNWRKYSLMDLYYQVPNISNYFLFLLSQFL